jgi:hypothetical protein
VFKGEIMSKHEQPLAAVQAALEMPKPEVPAPTKPKAAPKKRKSGVKHAAAS